ncbi:MAG: isochorismatase [Desulfobulbaceae bacterium A2]|nr:MAG: isochorismatase [Desulfobulbaceae bacterium A2]
MTDILLSPERCCLWVIDPQERLMAQIHEAERVVRRTALLLHCARTLAMPVIACTQYRKGIGPIVPELATLLEGVPCEDKLEFNGLANPRVAALFEALPKQVDTLLIAGVETHICISQSSIGALQAGYRTWVAADAVSSRQHENHQMGLTRLLDLGVTLAPSEMIVYELLRKAGTPAFKAMLPHLK